MDARAQQLQRALARYRRDKKRAIELDRQASEDLAAAVREAYADGEGMKKADILRGIDHVWSRTWLDKAIKGDNLTKCDSDGTVKG